MTSEMLMVAAHPGEHIQELLDDYAMDAAALARALKVPTQRVTDVLTQRTDLSADLALRLARWLGQGPEFWVRLDAHHRAVRAMNANRAAIEAIEPKVDAA